MMPRPSSRPKAILSWSGGKDSAWALHEVLRGADFDVVGLLTTLTRDDARVSAHGVRESVLDEQVRVVGLPCRKLRLPSPCANAEYERALADVLGSYRQLGIGHVVYADLFLQDIRAYRERLMASLGVDAVFPLWGRDTRRLAETMLSAGVRAVITCVDRRRLDASFVGRVFDRAFLDDLPDEFDPCGENGEFHTLVVAGPMLRHPIPVTPGGIFEKGDFVYADLLPPGSGCGGEAR